MPSNLLFRLAIAASLFCLASCAEDEAVAVAQPVDTVSADAPAEDAPSTDMSSGDAEPPSGACEDPKPNAKGVGTPCATQADCAGAAGTECPAAEMASDLAFCTMECDIGMDDSCGAGAKCAGRGQYPPRCVPEGCFVALNLAPIYTKANIPCSAGKVNDLGVGTPCEVKADCAAETSAKSCPKSISPKLPNWCSMLCDVDDDCGADAFCWRRPSAEGGIVGSCTPTACRIFPPAKIPCDFGQVNSLGVGKPCTAAADCAGLAATSCPAAIKPALPNWCTLLCETDSDCGKNAYCWQRPSAEGGIVASCTPIGCQADAAGQ